MINRDNWADVNEYLAQVERRGRTVETVKRVRGLLRHLLEWADARPFGQARLIDPSFQTYLLSARNDGRSEQLSAASMKKACEYARVFFRFMREAHPARYKGLSSSWIDTVQPAVGHGMQSEFHEHEFYSLDQVKAIAAVEPTNVKEERDRAAVCFLFLSAMRVQAFVSLPVKAVSLDKLTVNQFPKLGVRTKNRKAARTRLLGDPELLGVVRAWDAKVRKEAPEGLWYPEIDRWHRFVAKEKELNWLSRCAILGDGLRELCKRAGVAYLSPHKLRHGHAVLMMRRARNMQQLKALSQNLMHAHVGITDAIYAKLVHDDLEETYEELGG